MGHVLPYNSGLLAREALAHPFFRVSEVPESEWWACEGTLAGHAAPVLSSLQA